MATVEELDREAREVIARAQGRDLPLRTVGGVGIWQRLGDAQRSRFLAVRPPPADIDLVAPPRTSKAIREIFESAGFAADVRLNMLRGDRRHRYHRLDADGVPVVDVDVFLGAPPLCHPIELGDRLGLPGPAMAPTDLQKLQIVEINAKDLTDICLLLAAHGVGDDEEGIVAERVATLLSRDWGFHRTSSENLTAAGAAATVLDEADAATARQRIAALRAAVDATPKTRRWRMRARVGTRAQWYEEVEEVDR
jgi:hypothetical protein